MDIAGAVFGVEVVAGEALLALSRATEQGQALLGAGVVSRTTASTQTWRRAAWVPLAALERTPCNWRV